MEKLSSRILSRADKFIQVVASVHGYNLNSDNDKSQAQAFLESEAYYLESLIDKSAGTKNDLSDTTAASQSGLFLEVIGQGLSFNPAAKLVQLIYRNTTVSNFDPQGRRVTTSEKRLAYYPSAEGKMSRCIRAGSILRVRPPQIVLSRGDVSDVFNHSQINGVDNVHYVDNCHGSGRIEAGFVWIVLPDGSQDFFKFYRADMDRLHKFAKSNGYDNDLYSSNNGDYDPSFFKSKLVSHSLNRYDKNRKPSSFEAPEDSAPVAMVGGDDSPEVIKYELELPNKKDIQNDYKLW